MDSDVAYGVMAYGKTEVQSIQYTTGWDTTYSNAYFGVSLKGDDYLGDGAQVERHPDYYSSVYTTNHYSNKITVDGEGEKAESYGLFNLGEKGKGYFSFVFRAAEEDSESITIPAGTLFPSRAMRTLFETNSNPVYIMYETQTDVTFYKQADGTWQKPYTEKTTDVTSVKVSGSDSDNFTVIMLANHDYLDTLDNYGGSAVSTKNFLANSNFYSHVLIDDVALGSTNEAYVNVWGNKGAFAFRTSNGTLTSKITILAGCEFPSYAELSTGERIKYVTTKDVTFVKNSEGVFVEESDYVNNYIEEAKAELDAYKVGLFREAEEAQRLQIVENAKAQLNDTLSEQAVINIVDDAKIAINALKTAAEYEAEEKEAALAAAREAAYAEINAYKADEVYFAEQAAARESAIEAANDAFLADTTEEEIAITLAQYKASIDNIPTKAQVIASAKAELDAYKAQEGYFLADEAAQRAEIVANAKAAIDNATYNSDVNDAVANAKAAIDALTPAAEVYTTQDVAMLGRVAGWYGNGNFTLAITLGTADWTNDNAGTHTYNGDLSKLLNKLDLFNHIKLGDKTLAQWGCVACYDNGYDLNAGEPDNIFLLHLSMGAENMAAATEAGISGGSMVTLLEGALVPSYGYLTQTGNIVYRAGADYVTIVSDKAYGLEATAKTEVESVKYVQGHDGNCGYFGISFVGDDYLGDGSQLEINSNYNYDNKFVDLVLVNGEAGKVGYYGLFNLGANGKGYYAFAMYVPEEEIQTITIPAGTKFPTRAMTDLRVVNGNPVYIMYEVETDITLCKTENGYVPYDEAASAQLDSYKVGMFREAEEAQRVEIIANAKVALAATTVQAEKESIVAQALAAIDALKTAAQYEAEEKEAALEEVKANAIAEIEGYKAFAGYFEEQMAARAEIIANAKATIAGLTNETEVWAAETQAKSAIDALAVKTEIVEAAKTELDGYKAQDGYFREEEAAQRAEIVANAKTAIDEAATQAAVNAA
ncbi:MAG: hypothetical protein IIX02_05755, partial [Clostridia bacterium]|nr:hypothetical protein [Clostridia bacterium]